MAMTQEHVFDIIENLELDEYTVATVLPLALGAGVVDPELIAPRDGQEDQQVEDLIAFRCSCL